MSIPVKTVASGGLPVMDATVGSMAGITVTEAPGGMAVMKVSAGGLPVTFVSPVGGGGGGGGTTYATWDTATATSVTLSGGNLVATNTGTTSTSQGARVADVGGKASGKYYIEIEFTNLVDAVGGGSDCGVGVGTTTSTYAGMGFTGGVTGIQYFKSQAAWANGSSVAPSTSQVLSGQKMGIAVDLDNRKVWFKKLPSGNWNENASYNPATNTGGYTISAGTMAPFTTFGGAGGSSGYVTTANFGASAFTGAVPSGFTSGWPV